MKVCIVNTQKSYLFHEFGQGFTDLGHEVGYIYDDKGTVESNPADGNHRGAFLQKCRAAIDKENYDLMIILNHWADWEIVFPYNRTVNYYADPPHHFSASPYCQYRVSKYGGSAWGHIEFGIPKEYFTYRAPANKFKAGACVRIAPDQEFALKQQGNLKVYESFANRNWLRKAGIVKAINLFNPFLLIGEREEWQHFFADQSEMHLQDNPRIAAFPVAHEELHKWFAECEIIIDSVRPEITLNPKVQYAHALGKQALNIELVKGEVVLKEIPNPGKIRTAAEMCQEIIDKACVDLPEVRKRVLR